jgi:hypothetical protein
MVWEVGIPGKTGVRATPVPVAIFAEDGAGSRKQHGRLTFTDELGGRAVQGHDGFSRWCVIRGLKSGGEILVDDVQSSPPNLRSVC